MRTKVQNEALRIALRDGAVCAGKSCDKSGRVIQISAMTIKALARIGLLRLCLSPDGGMMGRITDGARATAEATGEEFFTLSQK